MFEGVKLRLVNDWRHAWKWSSIRFLATGGAIQTVVVTCPAGVAQHVPEWVWQTMSCFALFCMVAAGMGRVTTIEPKDEDDERHEHI